jgi:hypothetical protein
MDDATISWLEVNLPQALEPYRLWRANTECIAIARRLAREWEALGKPSRHGELLVAANLETARQSGLAYGGEVVAARERAELAATASGASESQVGLATARAQRLAWLEADVVREVLT